MMQSFDDYYGYSRSFKFGHVLRALDFRSHFHIHYIVLHLCDARQPAYYWCGVHGAFHIYIYSIFPYVSTLPNFFKQAIALFNMIRSISLNLCSRKQNNTSILEPHLMSFLVGLCRFSRFILSHVLCLALSKSLVVFLQTQITLNRIAVYLDEEEVTDQVSSLKKDYSEPYLFGDDEGLGLVCATFKWNEVVEVVKTGKQWGQNKSSTISLVTDEASSVVDAESIGDRGDRVFELRNMTIRFPEGELTVVTGPTASGKTALLVSS